jgi:pimeloyl-ACP methyl ester carboxylesterase
MNEFFRDQYVTVNNLKLHLVDWAPGGSSKPPMVLIHGVTGYAHMWDHIALNFKDEYHVLALDQRGHGDSDWSPEQAYESADLGSDLTALFSELKLKDAVLVGASWGGLSSILHTANHPDTVRQLILVDIGMEFSQSETDVFPRPREFKDYKELETHERNGNLFPALWTLRGSIGTSVRSEGDVLVRKHDPFFFERWPFRNRDYWTEAGQIKVPTLLMHGSDSFVLSAEMAQKTAAAIPNCELVEIGGAGHSIQLDNPPAFEAAIREFLKK